MKIFDRRRVVPIVVSLLFAASAFQAHAQDPATAFDAWAAGFYRAEIARHARQAPQLSDEETLNLFTPELAALIVESRNHVPPRSEPVGPILHLFLGWGAFPNREITLNGVTAAPAADGKSRATVDITIEGYHRLPLVLTGVFDRQAKRWHIADIDYGAGSLDTTLVGRMRRIATWPAR
jgi:hypothetical protein